MAHEEKLPRELTEEILSCVPPKSLVRLKTVSKQWNALLDDKKFINNHKSTFRFILATKSKIYSVRIDPKIELHELTLDIPDFKSQKPKNLINCEELLLFVMDKGAAVWNPWLNRTRWIKTDVNQPGLQIDAIGYGNNMRDKESVYKTIGSYHNESDPNTGWKIHDFVSDAWKDYKTISSNNRQGGKRATLHTKSGVSLHGHFYWIAYYDKIMDPLYHLVNFVFSYEKFFTFCDLPCGLKNLGDALVLRVYNGDRFSLLRQCHETKKIDIWVTKNKINYEDGDDVVWMSFMTLSVPNLVQTGSYCEPSYFIDDKRLVVCSCDETGQAWIYVARENELIRKVKLDSVVDRWPLHCCYFPSLVPVPRGEREEERLQV